MPAVVHQRPLLVDQFDGADRSLPLFATRSLVTRAGQTLNPRVSRLNQ